MIDRYRNPQVLTSARIETLVKINKVKNMENLELLRKRYNDIENCIRILESLKTESSTYGYLLIPLLKEKTPGELNMTISQKFSGNVWTLELMLKYHNEELQAKEIFVPFKSTSNDKDREKIKIGLVILQVVYIVKVMNQKVIKVSIIQTASCLHSEGYESKSHKGVYYSDNHSPSQCKNLTTRKSRIDILKKSYRCFLCLKSGRLVFSRFFDISGNLGNVKEKPTGKTCFSREMECLALCIYLVKFC